ncbi:MAG: 23S rRNA (guanosine(2251)-2'-O)-methyltransferase RlmB [Roseiflexaceae bacterium]|nr:23S rRNA (guanosine(2251)-2'-O)-methyltransferase RlmB [Roseiflexaceae bacterium]
MADILYGRNAVREALRAQRRSIKRLIISSGAQENTVLVEIAKLAEGAGVPIERIERQALDKQLRDANHQGVALECGPYPYVELDDCLKLAETRGQQIFLLLLDHLQDPQNIGTLLRTAEAVGVHGVIMPGRRAAEITPAVVNASAGATEHLHIAIVTNLAQTIDEVQKQGVWVVGADEDERSQLYDQVDMDMPLALVIGAEGTGLARLTREKCDFIVKLPMVGQIESLNAAVAGSILLYSGWRARAK